MAAVLKAEKARREKEEKGEGWKDHLKMKDKPVKMEDTLTKAEWENSERLQFAPPPRTNHRFMQQQRKLDDIHNFLGNLEWSLGTPEQMHGITWPELFYI